MSSQVEFRRILQNSHIGKHWVQMAQKCPIVANLDKDLSTTTATETIRHKQANGEFIEIQVQRNLLIDPIEKEVRKSLTTLDTKTRQTITNNHGMRKYYMTPNRRNIWLQRIAFWAELCLICVKFCKILESDVEFCQIPPTLFYK